MGCFDCRSKCKLEMRIETRGRGMRMCLPKLFGWYNNEFRMKIVLQKLNLLTKN